MCVICGFVYDEEEGWPEDGIKPGTRWEDVPDEDLWEDGEIKYRRIVMAKVFNKIYEGKYKLMRRKNEL